MKIFINSRNDLIVLVSSLESKQIYINYYDEDNKPLFNSEIKGKLNKLIIYNDNICYYQNHKLNILINSNGIINESCDLNDSALISKNIYTDTVTIIENNKVFEIKIEN